MTPSFIRRCSRCGISVPSELHYCPQCGLPMEVNAGPPTVISREGSSPQMPPAPLDPYSAPTQMAPSPAGGSQPPVFNYPPTLQAASLPPQQNKSGRGLKRAGCVGIAAALILVLLLGTAGYFLMRFTNARSTTATGGSNAEATPTQSPVITTPLGGTITYASVLITLVNAQQASHFVDDHSTSSVGALRLNIHESQAAPLDTGGSTTDPYYGYDKAFNLILPGGKVIAPESTKIASGPTGKASQDNWLDFSVSPAIKVNQLTLRIGGTNEAQMDVPLIAHADLSTYQSQVVHLTTRVPYGDTFWTLTTASKQWSDGGKQAGKEQRFLVVAVSVDNPSSSDVNAYSPDYLRLQVGDNQVSETNDNMPTGFAAGTTSSKGLVAFLVPQESTNFALVLLGNSTAQQATIPFTLASRGS
jgi:hypothetical protein